MSMTGGGGGVAGDCEGTGKDASPTGEELHSPTGSRYNSGNMTAELKQVLFFIYIVYQICKSLYSYKQP